MGFLVKNDILKVFTVSVQDDSTEGILWLKFIARNGPGSFLTCVCYLPPIDSTRGIDANEFFDQLICQIHQYCKDSMFYICGDFNARCSDLQDFIAGVDSIPERQVIDFTTNKYGELLCEFLIDSSCCMLNGRNPVLSSNNFTCVRSQGASVVDYCLVPYDDLSEFTEFKVLKVSDLINKCGIIHSLDCNTSIPDHSILAWKMDTGTMYEVCNNDTVETEYTTFDRVVPETFLNDCMEQLEEVINGIEHKVKEQKELDKVYTEFEQILDKEMHLKLNPKKTKIQVGTSNKKKEN